MVRYPSQLPTEIQELLRELTRKVAGKTQGEIVAAGWIWIKGGITVLVEEDEFRHRMDL